MNVDRSLVGALAAALFAAEDELIRREHDVEDMLDSLYGPQGWQDWSSNPYDKSIDVYGVVPSPAAVAALRRGGFALCHQHNHASTEFRLCACRVRQYE